MNTSAINELQSDNTEDGCLQPKITPGDVIIGTLVSIDLLGNPLVSFLHASTEAPVVAISTIAITPQHLGRQVALLFTNGEIQKPIIAGFIYSPLNVLLENFSASQETNAAELQNDQDPFDGHIFEKLQDNKNAETLLVDGKRIVFEGEEEIVLRCGDSSITLTKAGKIVIRGKYLVSRSAGVNRILGGSVQVN